MRLVLMVALLALGCASRSAAPPPVGSVTPAHTQTSVPAERVDPSAEALAKAETDEYTRYELLAPETAQFHILYEVTAISPGATARQSVALLPLPLDLFNE